MNRTVADILIIGGGPAGLAAAAAASECGRTTVIVDDNPRLGGQIWRTDLGRVSSPDAAALMSAIDAGNVRIVNNARVFARSGENVLAAQTPDGRADLEFRKLILATGARELFLPFPGWTLPGVFGAGGLQALVKGGLDIAGKRIVIAGTGPLLIAVADQLRKKGATVAAIVEQATASKVNRLAFSLLRSPAKLIQAAALRARLIGVPYMTGSWVTRVGAASPTRSGESAGQLNVSIKTDGGKNKLIECDLLACGYHLVPNTELARLLGCRVENGFVTTDEFHKTTESDIYCAGEPTGIGGLGSALVEGRIAALAACGKEEQARGLFAKRSTADRFTASLGEAFALRDELRHLSDAATIVCRCEDVQYERLSEFGTWRTAKLQTRCGMGPCQGRVCGAAAEFLFGWTTDPPRPPIFPVKLENL